MANRPDAVLVRKFILDNVQDHPSDIVRLTAEAFHVTRQTAHNYLTKLVNQGLLKADGRTRNRSYTLAIFVVSRTFSLAECRDEDKVWRTFVASQMANIPENVAEICDHGFTEMFNNIIDHSEGKEAIVTIERTVKDISISVQDDGIGIFEKIRSRFGLEDHRQAILELAKGKRRRTPNGIAERGFTSRRECSICSIFCRIF